MLLDILSFDFVNGIKTAMFCVGTAVLLWDLRVCLEEMILDVNDDDEVSS